MESLESLDIHCLNRICGMDVHKEELSEIISLLPTTAIRFAIFW
jgi:hypothetical protein